MALQIRSSPSDPDEVVADLREAIENAIPGSGIEVRARGAGHFEIKVTSGVFAGKPRVAQQQLVYAAIAHLMDGDPPPVHAIDKLETQAP